MHEQFEAGAPTDRELYPLEGRVFDCRPYRENTFISVYQTVPNLFSFPNLGQHRAFLVLPEFWNFLEERSEYEDLAVPDHRQLWQIKTEGSDMPDIRDATWAIHRYGLLSGRFDPRFVPGLCGSISARVESLERLCKRAAFGNRMKLHLLTLRVSDGRSHLLDELIHEGPMTLEHAAFVTYGILDLCSVLVNRTLALGIADKRTSFTAVLGKESADETVASLTTLHPDSRLTSYWIEQQASWIAKFRDLRHNLAHEGVMSPVHGPNERLLAICLDHSAESPNRPLDVENEINGWLDRAKSFYASTLELLAAHSLEAVKPYEGQSVQAPINNPFPATEIENAFRDLLRLFFQRDDENPSRVSHLYSRLEPGWRRRWPLAEFKAFLAAWEGVVMESREPGTSSSDGKTSSVSATILYTFAGHGNPWKLCLQKRIGQRPALIGNELTRPTFPESFVHVSEYRAQQSGRETGHQCAEFRFVLTNTSKNPLAEVVATITHGGLEATRNAVGLLNPGESQSVFAITTPELGTLLPPGGPYMLVTLISEPATVRLTYRRQTDWGDEWAEEHVCSNHPD